MILRSFTVIAIYLIIGSFASDTVNWKPVERAIKKGSASDLSVHFGSSVTVSVPDNSGVFSSRQARLILDEFFKANPPKSFNIYRTGAGALETEFCLGSYLSKNEDSFSVYILMNLEKEKNEIMQITFEES